MVPSRFGALLSNFLALLGLSCALDPTLEPNTMRAGFHIPIPWRRE